MPAWLVLASPSGYCTCWLGGTARRVASYIWLGGSCTGACCGGWFLRVCVSRDSRRGGAARGPALGLAGVRPFPRPLPADDRRDARGVPRRDGELLEAPVALGGAGAQRPGDREPAPVALPGPPGVGVRVLGGDD